MSQLTPEERRQIFLDELARYERQQPAGNRFTPRPKKHGAGFYVGIGCLWLVGLYVVAAIVLAISDSSNVTKDRSPGPVRKDNSVEDVLGPSDTKERVDLMFRLCAALKRKPIGSLSSDQLDQLEACRAIDDLPRNLQEGR